MGTRSVEEVADVCGGRKFFQVYVWRDRELMADLLKRSAAAGYEAIMITVDTAVLGRRERDVRHGFSLPPKLGPDTIIDGLLHPRWLLDFLSNEPIKFSNCEGATVATAAMRSRWPSTSTASSTRRCRGTTSSGSEIAGTDR